MSAHPHAELMALYAEDARETAEPWLRWQEGVGINKSWHGCSYTPAWYPKRDYRRKPPPPRVCLVADLHQVVAEGSSKGAWPMGLNYGGTPMIELTPEVLAALKAAGIEAQS